MVIVPRTWLGPWHAKLTDLVYCSLFRICSNLPFITVSHYLGIIIILSLSFEPFEPFELFNPAALHLIVFLTFCRLGPVLENVVLN